MILLRKMGSGIDNHIVYGRASVEMGIESAALAFVLLLAVMPDCGGPSVMLPRM